MSMNAMFVQVDETELSRLKSDPSRAEALFEQDLHLPAAFGPLTSAVQERVRAAGPQFLAGVLGRMDPSLRKQLDERLGRNMEALASGAGGNDLLRMMQDRRAPMAGAGQEKRAVLPLDKAWPGIHYLLSGGAEPGQTLVSQAVLGGAVLGDDDEGF